MINASHGDKPVYGNIESITFVAPSSATLSGTVKASLDKHIQHSSNIATLSFGPAVVAHHVQELKQLIFATGQTKASSSQATAIGRILDEYEVIDKKLSDAATSLNNFKSEAKSIVDNAGLGGVPWTCDELEKRLSGDIRRKLLAVAHEIVDRQDALGKWLDNLTEVAVESCLGQCFCRNPSGQGSPGPRTCRGAEGRRIGSAPARQCPHRCTKHIGRRRTRGAGHPRRRRRHRCDAGQLWRRLKDLLSACSSTVDWTASRYDRLREQVREELSNLPLELNSAVADFSQRIAAELGPAGWILAEALSREYATEVAALVATLQLSIPVDWDGSVPTKVMGDCVTTIQDAQNTLADVEKRLRDKLNKADALFQKDIDDLQAAMQQMVEQVLCCAAIVPALINDVTNDLIATIDGLWKRGQAIGKDQLKNLTEQIRLSLSRLEELLTSNQTLDRIQSGLLKPVNDLCNKLKTLHLTLDLGSFQDTDLKDLKDDLAKIQAAYKGLRDAKDDVASIKSAITGLSGDLDSVRDGWTRSVSAGQAYTTRVMEGFSRVANGSLSSTPSSVLRLMAAATAAPEIAQLQSNVDRMRCAYDDAKVQTTKVRAALARLGDALKALGIDIPTEELSEKIEISPDALSKYDITKLFPNMGGLNLKGLLPDIKVPAEAKDAIRISHDFDRKQFRAWVQVDVNYPIKGRKELYSFGPFAVFFRDTTLTGVMRAEASQDSSDTKTTARSQIDTHIDVDIGGERMLSLEKVAIHYEQGSGLKFDFDPKSIRLQAALQFVQDTLGGLMGDQMGGLQIIKEKGIPVGVQHVFTLPTISIMAGTSGVSNIQLSNVFRLLAYPDFVLTNRFNLSRPELPFIFSFFIVGGTGYIVIDATYRPLDGALTVGVECAAGGSASFGFSLGPVSGSVFVAFDLVITYTKTISRSVRRGAG